MSNFSEADTRYMRLAIDASRAAVAEGNFPYGATLLSADGRAHVSHNNQVTTGDCTGHAEVVLVREVAQKLGLDALVGATVYASGEPCAMCTGALFWAGVSRIVYAMPTPVLNAIGGAPYILPRTADVLAGASRKISVEGPLLEEEATAVLREFAAR
ncbi:nucleoside deaminase [Uliginosibacterium sp. H3]|uniref:Nucleoside deaminase n=1 Tax=Uliginosibacterium silvisoli TaxID=3114758 RepID=A0ABU6K1E5_9RHOO|nr:nucleoside deaminase [Uliginosibacterium sp. H3]